MLNMRRWVSRNPPWYIAAVSIQLRVVLCVGVVDLKISMPGGYTGISYQLGTGLRDAVALLAFVSYPFSSTSI